MEKLKGILESKGFKTIVVNRADEVKDFFNRQISANSIVGLGNSLSAGSDTISEVLKEKGSTIYYSWDGSEDYNRNMDSYEVLPKPDYYLSCVDAITKDGKMVMQDAYSDTAFKNKEYPKHVFWLVGLNKNPRLVEKDMSEKNAHIIDGIPESSNFTVVLVGIS